MKTTIFLSGMLLLFCTFPLSGQTPQTTFQVTAGVSPYLVFDQAASPFVYRTNLYQAGFQFRREGAKQVWDLSLRGGFGSSKSMGTGHREIRFMGRDIHGVTDTFDVVVGGQLLRGTLEAGWAYRLSPSLAVGLRAGDELYYAQGFVYPGLMNLAYLAPQLDYARTLGEKHRVSARVAVPVLALINRPSYHGSVSLPETGQAGGFFRQNFSVNTVNRFQRASLELAYQYRISGRISLGLGYSAFFMHHDDLSTLRALDQSLMASLTFHSR